MKEKKKVYYPGKYYAICNTTNFDDHYIKEFDYPQEAIDLGVSPDWWFLNRVNFTACIEATYPRDIFPDKLPVQVMEKPCATG